LSPCAEYPGYTTGEAAEAAAAFIRGEGGGTCVAVSHDTSSAPGAAGGAVTAYAGVRPRVRHVESTSRVLEFCPF